MVVSFGKTIHSWFTDFLSSNLPRPHPTFPRPSRKFTRSLNVIIIIRREALLLSSQNQVECWCSTTSITGIEQSAATETVVSPRHFPDSEKSGRPRDLPSLSTKMLGSLGERLPKCETLDKGLPGNVPSKWRFKWKSKKCLKLLKKIW